MMDKHGISQEFLQSLFSYDAATGLLRWKVSRGKARAGKVAGHDGQYGRNPRKQVTVGVTVGVRKGIYCITHIIWKYVTDTWPVGEVDHIDGDHTNQRWANLRDVSRQINLQNRHTPQKTNKSSGVLGVAWSKKAGKWQAMIHVDGKPIWLGYHLTVEEAQHAYLTAKRKLHPGCTI